MAAKGGGGGGGGGNKEAELPIDIQVEKFVDWLVSRQKVPAGWNAPHRDVRTQLAAAVAALPVAVKSKLTAGLDITDPNALHYWHCTDLLKLIEQSAAEAKAGGNKPAASSGWSAWLTGGSKDATQQQWEALMKAYEKQNLYLVDAARILVQNTVYEIPALKKLIATSAKQTAALERKIADSEHSAVEFTAKYADACRALGIPIHPSADVKAELLKTQSALEPLLRAIVSAAQAQDIGDAAAFYKAFSAQQLQLVYGDSAHTEAATRGLLPALQAVRTATAVPDAAVAAAKAKAPTTKAAAAAADEDDFGITVESSGAADATGTASAGGAAGAADEDFGITVEGAGDAKAADAKAPAADAKSVGGGIDWGALGGSAPADADSATTTTTAVSINWGDAGGAAAAAGDDKAADTKADAKTAAAGAGAGAAAGGHKGLDDTDTRNAFVTDLHELESFLTTRLTELQSGDDAGLLVQAAAAASKSGSKKASDGGDKKAAAAAAAAATAADASSSSAAALVVTGGTVDGVESWLQAVRDLLAQLRAPRLSQLLLLRTSKRYVERLVSGVKQKLLSAERMKQNAKTAEQRLDALRHTLSQSDLKLRALAAQTLALKAKVEAALSVQYDGRRVNLFGGELSTLPALAAAAK